MAKDIALNTLNALKAYNSSNNKAWNFGDNWNAVSTEFENFINNYLFPKLRETTLIESALGNRFDWLAEEIDFIGQYSEEYVIMDAIPTTMDLSKNDILMLKRNYPKIATRLYGSGILKKQKFTLNNNSSRHNFATLGDGIKYAIGVLNKRISDINVAEEREVKSMLIDYAMNHTKDKRQVTSMDDLVHKVFVGLLNIQNNSHKYNESSLASGGSIGQYTTSSKLESIMIVTSDIVKEFLLKSDIANTFQISGLDLTSRIVSFDDLGGTFKTTKDIKISSADTLKYLNSYGDYQTEKGDLVPEGSIFLYDVSALDEFTGNVIEIKPTNDIFAYVLDVNKIRYQRHTKRMLKPPFINGEFDEVTYWIHYYSNKSISPFYNNIVFLGE